MFENEELRKWLMFLVLIVLTWIAIRMNKILFTQMRKKKDELKLKFFERFNVVIILTVAVILSFSVFGALGELWKTLLGGTAVITAVLAFTAQDIIKDILAGFMISIYKPFEIGNRIELENGTCGIVKDITMRHVALSLLDSTVCVIPNSKLNAMSVINYSYQSGLKAKQFAFHIAYDSDVSKAIKVIREAIISSSYTVPGVRKGYIMDYAPVYFMEFESSSLLLKTTVYFPPDVATEVMTSDVNLRVDLALNENKIEIPYNYVNVVNREIGEKQGSGKLVRSGRPYVTADVLHLVELVVVAVSSGLIVDAYQRVLLPAPCADLSIEEGHVPILIDRNAVVHVVLEQVPGIHEITPAVGSVEALLLAHHHGEFRITFVNDGKCGLACPLEGCSFYILAYLGVGENCVHKCPVRAFHGAEIDFDPFFLH